MFRIELKAQNFSWYSAAAYACFAVSVLAAIVGSLLTSGWLLNAQVHPWLYDLGLLMLILALPILMLGGHCLDLLDRWRSDASSRSAHFRKTLDSRKRSRQRHDAFW